VYSIAAPSNTAGETKEDSAGTADPAESERSAAPAQGPHDVMKTEQVVSVAELEFAEKLHAADNADADPMDVQ